TRFAGWLREENLFELRILQIVFVPLLQTLILYDSTGDRRKIRVRVTGPIAARSLPVGLMDVGANRGPGPRSASVGIGHVYKILGIKELGVLRRVYFASRPGTGWSWRRRAWRGRTWWRRRRQHEIRRRRH